MVVVFGNMFNNLRLVRYNKAGTIEIERITVPLTYSTKEKFYSRITQDPNLFSQINTVLPRMAFELTSITYDPLRKVSSFQNQYSPNSANSAKSAYQTPYNFNFNLSIFVRNTEDGSQIVEQILPYFNPDHTGTVNLVDVGPPMDIPIILDSVSYDVSNDTGSAESLRVITWNLSFTAKGYLYGPINTTGDKYIRKAIANTYLENTGSAVPVQRTLTMSSGFGEYKIDELVYEGSKLEEANATAFVRSWDSTANNLVVYEIDGIFRNGFDVKGAVTNANYVVSSSDVTSGQVVYLTVQPDPLSANANDDYGFTTTIEEYPNIT
jgi:hypothetical protein